MAVFFTTNNGGDTFHRNPKVGKAPIGWVIDAYCDDPAIYGGHYIKTVGYADDTPKGKKGWALKRDAKAAMAEAIRLGVLKVEA